MDRASRGRSHQALLRRRRARGGRLGVRPHAADAAFRQDLRRDGRALPLQRAKPRAGGNAGARRHPLPHLRGPALLRPQGGQGYRGLPAQHRQPRRRREPAPHHQPAQALHRRQHHRGAGALRRREGNAPLQRAHGRARDALGPAAQVRQRVRGPHERAGHGPRGHGRERVCRLRHRPHRPQGPV